ncbi:MAG TPA: MarR family transcriptional regulator [Stellaceae bacterium]|jgi:DNA-binding MarR family transcriptional regulator|nr:MarR family transcriptional regulator [Stellaceae bacterium]
MARKAGERAAHIETDPIPEMADGIDLSQVEEVLRHSIGAELRHTHRSLVQDLQDRLEAVGLPIGMWYFLRVLWEEDGLTQRELSQKVGSMEPTTVEQLRNMEARGLIERRRSEDDRRKMHVHLTPAGIELKQSLLPIGGAVNATALHGLSNEEVAQLRELLGHMRRNLEEAVAARRQALRQAGGTARSSRTRRAAVAG